MTPAIPSQRRPLPTDPRPIRVGMFVISEYASDPRVRRQAEALAARGDEVTVVSLHAADRPREETIDGVHVVHLPVRKYRGESAKSYLGLYGGFAARAAAWAARRPRAFDLIQAHSMPETLVFCAAIQRMLRVPVLLDVHDRTTELFASKFGDGGALMSAVRLNERASLRFASEVLTVHEPYAETLRGLTRRPVTVVMNCPDDRLFRPRPWRDWADGVVFGYHGLIAPRHGLANAVEALASVRAELPGARFHIRGSGDGLDALRTRVDELGLADAVDLPTRLLSMTEIAKELDGVHIGVVPSRRDPWTERVLPTKLLEYAAIGIPVITFRNPVIEQYFPEDAVTYVDPASPERLRAAMLELARDPGRARAQATRATEVMATLSWQHQKQIYFEVVDRLTARARV